MHEHRIGFYTSFDVNFTYGSNNQFHELMGSINQFKIYTFLILCLVVAISINFQTFLLFV